MIGSERTLYPMLGVGAFFVMFWVGFVVGYELGLNCGLFLLNAFFFACTGAWCVVKLEMADAHPSALRTAPPDGRGGRSGRESGNPVMIPNPFVPR